MDDRGFIARFAAWAWRDGPVWITVASIVFLIVINRRFIAWLP